MGKNRKITGTLNVDRSTPFVVSGRGEREVNRDVHLLPLIHHTLSNKNNLFTTCNHK